MAINFPNNPAVNDTFTVGGTKFTFTGDKWESGAVVELSSDITPQLSGELNAGSHNINNAGVITATAFHGDGSNLTGITDAAANTYGNATAVPQIVVGANGRITGITNVSISGGGGGGGSSIILKNNQSLVGAAGTIDFGTGLSVSTISAGVGTVTVNGSQVDAGSVGGSALTALQKNDADTDLVMNNQILHFGAANTKSRIRWSGTTSLWDLVDGDLKFRDNLTDRFTFERTTGNFTATGTVTATSFTGSGIGLTSIPSAQLTGALPAIDGSALTNLSGSIPSGGIIIWSGASNAIPTGWVLCDGQNSTPDLRDRFVIGAGSNYAVDATGGSADAIVVSHSHSSGSLQTNNTGDHGHSGNTDDSGNHTHGGGNYITNTTGSHQHRWGTDDSDGAQGTGNPDANGGQSWKAWTDSQGDHYHNVNGNSQSEGNHSHNINTNNDGSHQHNMNGDTGSQGSSGTGANLPPYYALCYIMKS